MYSDSCAVREATLLTPEKVAERGTFLDWDTQPSMFKRYPDFCYRVSLSDHPSLTWLAHTRFISDSRQVAAKAYHRLNVPSAGNLHPIEIYVQIRNMEGLLSGIYHFDALTEELVMIAEIASDGIEPAVGLSHRFSGCIVMISLVPFRSSWKYALRSWRYLYLDLGHQIGALSASVRHFGLTLTKMSDGDGMELNRIMGMGEDERIVAVYGVGVSGERSVKGIRDPLMRVQPIDYSLKNEQLWARIRSVPLYLQIPETAVWDNYEIINRKRRSVREFIPGAMVDSAITALIDFPSPISLEIVPIVLQAHAMHCGVYRSGSCVEEENFIAETVHLLLEQRFIESANMVILIYSEYFSAQAHIEAGIYAQELYLACEHLDVGCSGIGAFYDMEGSRWSQNGLLYAVAIGGRL